MHNEQKIMAHAVKATTFPVKTQPPQQVTILPVSNVVQVRHECVPDPQAANALAGVTADNAFVPIADMVAVFSAVSTSKTVTVDFKTCLELERRMRRI
ncbi:hypothetical protein [Rathayibacter sp. AY2B3]|nr:hypothetical protein [Rathayibacter sp. AY2B3]